MSIFSNAIRKVFAHHRFYYRNEPWKGKEALEALEKLLHKQESDSIKPTDPILYQRLLSHIAKIPKTLKTLKENLRNLLVIYQNTLSDDELATKSALFEAEADAVNLRGLCKKEGKIIAIGYNEISKKHIIKIQSKEGEIQTYCLTDNEHNYSSGVLLGRNYRVGQALLTKRLTLSELGPFETNPRDQLHALLRKTGSSHVLLVIEPCSFDPNGQINLLTEKDECVEIDLEGQRLFIGHSDDSVQDKVITFQSEIEEGVEKQVPVRIWKNPQEAVVGPDVRQKIVLALHGLFDHKGAFRQLAHTLLANFPSVENPIIMALDWPTYGTSTDRNNPMPSSQVLKECLFAVLKKIQQEYDNCEIYLVGESLGAMMILIAGEELAAFNDQYDCISGAVVISPPLHNPTDSLYFQRRSLQMSAAPSIFHKIWFHDPEVNHSNSVTRLRTTLPYLAESYQSMQKWPDSIPCALFFASKDSVVAKKPIIEHYQSSKNPAMVHYAFPSRHLILRSISEGGNFIDGELVRKDIAATIQYMSNNDFSAKTVLPFTGAQSAPSMQWYQRCYSKMIGRAGYLDSWPHADPDKAFVFKKQGKKKKGKGKKRKPKDIPAPQQPMFLLGKTSKHTLIEFHEHRIVGDGDCGFHALATTRDRFLEPLLLLKNNAAARSFLAPEIRASFLSDDIPERLKPKTWPELHLNYRRAWDQLEKVMRTLKASIVAPYPVELDLAGRAHWLRDQLGSIDQRQQLQEAFQGYQKANLTVDSYCQQPKIFELYLELYRLPRVLWLGYKSALLWAKTQRVSLSLWRKDQKDRQNLVLIESQLAPDESNAFHLLHTSGFTHFNLLEVMRVRDLRAERKQIRLWNQTEMDLQADCLLHEPFLRQATKTPAALAVVSHRGNKTYREIAEASTQVAHALKAHNVRPNQLIGVLMEKGWEQAVACYGIFQSGAAFLPVDPEWPPERIEEVLTLGEVNLVLSQTTVLQGLNTSTQPKESSKKKSSSTSKVFLFNTNIAVLAVDNSEWWSSFSTTPLPRQQKPSDIAYVIFTSGSTGKPKGVVISHQNVVNTLMDINRRFQVGSQDSILALSSLTFDLAIYDLFGLLAVGGTVVFPEPQRIKEPSHWLELINQNNITLWNTVPMFMQMQVDYLEAQSVSTVSVSPPNSLRLVLLSGDWIPLTLPDRIRTLFTKSEVISLGGATEGSVWSILYPVKQIDPTWKSIPYGCPMTNQHMYVLTDELEHCTFGEVGEIHIGGTGVALGYWRDRERTQKSFLKHPRTGEPLYKTGDLGAWSPHGHIEFLGRKDQQVKINGYRIELGEIEAALSKHSSVQQCVVEPFAHNGQQKQLVAYVVPNVQEVHGKMRDNHVQAWETVYDETYQPDKKTTSSDATFNIAGWNSSYTGKSLPVEDMQEWVQDTVARLRAHHPRHVLEIGCGTGLLLGRVAPDCEIYVGTDISEQALGVVERLKQRDHKLDHVQLHKLEAVDLTGIKEGPFDTIIINSVIQCFPSVEYLVQVIENSIKRLTDGGKLFLGDLRSLVLLEAFHASVQFHQAADSVSSAELQKRVQKRCLEETELVVHPDFFQYLKRRIPSIQHVDIQLKQGKQENELNKFRYDVCLTISKKTMPLLIPQWQNTTAESTTLKDIRAKLRAFSEEKASDARSEEIPQVIGFRNFSNARLCSEKFVLEWLKGASDALNVGALKAVQPSEKQSIDPAALYALGRKLGLIVVTSWHQTDTIGTYDVVFVRPVNSVGQKTALKTSDSTPLIDFGEGSVDLDYHQYANSIVQYQKELIPVLQAFLRKKLPFYMVPNTLVLMKQLPLSSNGKVERKALPGPSVANDPISPIVAPSNPTEKTLSKLWCETLSTPTVGTRDNFFDLGGNSLLAVRLVLQINNTFSVLFPVSTIFTHNTIEKQAQLIQQKLRSEKGQSKSSFQPLLAFNEEGTLTPLFFVHSGRGGAEAYVTLANHLPKNQPFYAIEPYNFYSEEAFLETIEEMATQYLKYIRAVQPKGPYYLGGWSQGGLVAFEMARQLIQENEEIRAIYLLDTFLYHDYEAKQFLSGTDKFVRRDPFYNQLPEEYRERARETDKVQTIAMLKYKPHVYEGPVILLKAMEQWSFIETPEFQWDWITKKFMYHAFSKKDNGWLKYAKDLVIHPVAGHHQSIMQGENAKRMAEVIQADAARKNQSNNNRPALRFQFERYILSRGQSNTTIDNSVEEKKSKGCTVM